MNVLIAQSDPDVALRLAEQVARAGGRVTGIVLDTKDALEQMGRPRAPDILFLDAAMSAEAQGSDPAIWQQIRGRICLCGTARPDSGAPSLKDMAADEDVRLILIAARHFGQKPAALH